MAELTFHEKMIDIQQRLEVPKDIANDFGGFMYRNLDGIEIKLRPLLKEHGLIGTFNDEMVAVLDRVYVKSTFTVSDGTQETSTSAYAREAIAPKAKTDDAQLTGACSSYARKYAVDGMFLLGGTKDADSQDNSQPVKAASKVELKEPEGDVIGEDQLKALSLAPKQSGLDEDQARKFWGQVESKLKLTRGAFNGGTNITQDDVQTIFDALIKAKTKIEKSK